MTEHFVTLFDTNYAILGLALYGSLKRHAGDFCLWVVCMDSDTERLLLSLELPNLNVISLGEIENTELLTIKPGRTAGEYCWTMTPFSLNGVLKNNPHIRRVTYLDSDVFFFKDPRILLSELANAGKHVLITEHAYDPIYDQSVQCGRFCVQFVTMSNTPQGRHVCDWWELRCIEWCFNRIEDGKFGDQKYLDEWPHIFGSDVHVLNAVQETLAPWNVKRFLSPDVFPVMYHFHGLRFMNDHRVRLYDGYDVGRLASRLYSAYLAEIKSILMNSKATFALPLEPQAMSFAESWYRLKKRFNALRSEVSI
jgi:hypothetical protein